MNLRLADPQSHPELGLRPCSLVIPGWFRRTLNARLILSRGLSRGHRLSANRAACLTTVCAGQRVASRPLGNPLAFTTTFIIVLHTNGLRTWLIRRSLFIRRRAAVTAARLRFAFWASIFASCARSMSVRAACSAFSFSLFLVRQGHSKSLLQDAHVPSFSNGFFSFQTLDSCTSGFNFISRFDMIHMSFPSRLCFWNGSNDE